MGIFFPYIVTAILILLSITVVIEGEHIKCLERGNPCPRYSISDAIHF